MSALVMLLVFVPMLIEARRAGRNERAQRARGGVEPPGDVYPLMRVAYPAAFMAMVAESALRGRPSPSAVAAGIALFALAKSLKWWAIASLGEAWTFRVIVVPGSHLIDSGPYRYLRHPNYVAVIGELIAIALMTGARLAGPAATACFGALILKRIVVESRALTGHPKRRGRPDVQRGRGSAL
jgi:methyltransferase